MFVAFPQKAVRPEPIPASMPMGAEESRMIKTIRNKVLAAVAAVAMVGIYCLATIGVSSLAYTAAGIATSTPADAGWRGWRGRGWRGRGGRGWRGRGWRGRGYWRGRGWRGRGYWGPGCIWAGPIWVC